MRRDAFLKIVHDLKLLILEEKLHQSFLFSTFSSDLPLLKAPQKLRELPAPFSKKKEEKIKPPPIAERRTPSEEIKKEELAPPKTEIPPPDALRKAIEKSCSHLRLKTTIPNDEEATQRKNAWKQREYQAEVLLLSFATTSIEKMFIENIAKAISTLHHKAQVIDALEAEKERSWKALLELPQLSFIFAPPLESWRAPLLKTLVVEHPTTRETHLGKARLFFFPSLEKALNDPLNKRKLWQWIGQKLASRV